MYFEESTVQNENPDFRLGWIYIAPFVVAMLLPWMAKATIRRRIVYFFVSLAAIVVTLVLTVVFMFLVFGLVGVQ